MWRRELRTIGHTFLLLIGAKASCVDAAAAYVDVAGITLTRWQDWMRDTQDSRVSNDNFFFKVVKEDIKCKSN